MSVPILIFTVNISWGRWFVKSSLPWLIRFNAISPAIFFIFTFHFFSPPNQPTPAQRTTLLRGPTPLCRAQMGRTKLHSTGVTNSLPQGEEEEEEEGDDNVAGLFIRSICPFRRALNRSMANSRTNQRDCVMDSRHFGFRNSDWRRERTASQGERAGPCV